MWRVKPIPSRQKVERLPDAQIREEKVPRGNDTDEPPEVNKQRDGFAAAVDHTAEIIKEEIDETIVDTVIKKASVKLTDLF
jgi:hypothetical protein